jgi:hypothetical protein
MVSLMVFLFAFSETALFRVSCFYIRPSKGSVQPQSICSQSELKLIFRFLLFHWLLGWLTFNDSRLSTSPCPKQRKGKKQLKTTEIQVPLSKTTSPLKNKGKKQQKKRTG